MTNTHTTQQLKSALPQIITWFHHSSFCLNMSKRIYLDPWQLPANVELPKADIILITHPHKDHFSVDDILRIATPQTHIIAHPDCVGISGANGIEYDVEYVKPGEKIMIEDVVIDVVPAYNVNKWREPGIAFHPKEKQFNGYVIRIDGKVLYFASDTDVIAEMAELPNIDIAFVPVSGTYVMTPAEAAEAVKIIAPLVAIPKHYGSIVGTDADAQEFEKLVGERALILQKNINNH